MGNVDAEFRLRTKRFAQGFIGADAARYDDFAYFEFPGSRDGFFE